MTDQRVDCPVTIPPGKEVGEFANAFRVLPDSGTEWLLDFLVFSESERLAQVVSRIRIQGTLLPAIRDRLACTLTEICSPCPVGPNGIEQWQ